MQQNTNSIIKINDLSYIKTRENEVSFEGATFVNSSPITLDEQTILTIDFVNNLVFLCIENGKKAQEGNVKEKSSNKEELLIQSFLLKYKDKVVLIILQKSPHTDENPNSHLLHILIGSGYDVNGVDGIYKGEILAFTDGRNSIYLKEIIEDLESGNGISNSVGTCRSDIEFIN